MNLNKDWSSGAKSSSSQISRSSSLILASGTICLTLIMTVVRPAFRQWCKKTEFKKRRACASSPNEILESPSVDPTSGCLI